MAVKRVIYVMTKNGKYLTAGYEPVDTVEDATKFFSRSAAERYIVFYPPEGGADGISIEQAEFEYAA
jgi:hypothetical protein